MIDRRKIRELEKFAFVVFANECDLGVAASIGRAESMIEEQNMSLYAASAKTGKIFSKVLKRWLLNLLNCRRCLEAYVHRIGNQNVSEVESYTID